MILRDIMIKYGKMLITFYNICLKARTRLNNLTAFPNAP